MTAGSGIMHQEMPQGDAQGRMHGFQLWANLPSSLKMTAPRYQDIAARRHPRGRSTTTARECASSCGDFWGKKGPVEGVAADPRYLDVSVPPGTAQAARRSRPRQPRVRLRVRRLGHVPRRLAAARRRSPRQVDGTDDSRDRERVRAIARSCCSISGDEVVVQAGDEGIRFLLGLGQADRGAGRVVRADRDEHEGGAAAGDARPARRDVHYRSRGGPLSETRVLSLRPGRREMVKSVFAAVAFVLVCSAVTADARVTRIEIVESRAGRAVLARQCRGCADAAMSAMSGKFYGELDPADPKNALITDIQLAPRNARGKVEYVGTFSLMKPVDMSKASGVLMYSVVNRGNGAAAASAEGHISLVSGWQGDVVPTATNQTIQVPRAKNPDGSSITGPLVIRILDQSGTTAALMIPRATPSPYPPATLDTTKATLVSAVSESADGRQERAS